MIVEDKDTREQKIIDEAYKVSKKINEIFDKNREKEENNENER